MAFGVAAYMKLRQTRSGGAKFSSQLQGHFLNPLATNESEDEDEEEEEIILQRRGSSGGRKVAWYD